MAYENKDVASVERELETDIKNGLTQEEAERRLKEKGPNLLPRKKQDSVIITFLKQFIDPMIYILLGAVLINVVFLILGLTLDTNTANNVLGADHDATEDLVEIGIILAVILANAIIGTIQERKAMKAIDALNKMAAPHAFVKRNGKIIEVNASDVVVGDIVVLEEGNVIPADVRLIKAINLKCDEASLTGESVPSEKDDSLVFNDEVGPADRLNCAYMSSIVTYGRGEGIVIGTALNTEIGKVANLLNETEDDITPLQKKLAKLSKFLGILCIGIVLVMIVVDGVLRNPSSSWINSAVGGGSWFGHFAGSIKRAIALAVAAIPEGLVAVVTIVLALGMQRLAKVNTIVRKLPSVETLGAVSTICSDKTGTLTQNKMTVKEIYFNDKIFGVETADRTVVADLVRAFALSSNARINGESRYGDPTEVALIQLALDMGHTKDEYEHDLPRISELPFDSVRKMMSTLHTEKSGRQIMFTKGAIDQVLKCTTRIEDNGTIRQITKDDLARIEAGAKSMSEKALRVLAVAYKETNVISEDNLIFLGFIGMIDPPRVEAYTAVPKLRNAGITTIMITGDHIDTAFAIAKELTIATDREQCYTGAQLDAMDEEELQKVVLIARVFARVSPTNKTHIVNALKANNQIVAMTGDGVNDAPSLKAADIGIAMGITGTDVAKGAADMVLIDDNFASIEKAVEEGRGIFANIKKTVIFLLSSNMAEVISLFVAICIGLGHPLNTIHILWVNLVTDSLPAIALGMDSKDKNIMHEPPQNANSGLFSGGGLFKMIFYGILIAASTLLAYILTVVLAGGSFDFVAGRILGSESIVTAKFIGSDIEHMAQTSAFCTLAMSQLFHMFGMSSGKRSFFRTIKEKPSIMWVAFLSGIALQAAVCLIPGVTTVFQTSNLFDMPYLWGIIASLSVLPLIIHEVYCLVHYIIDRRTANKKQSK